MDKNIGSLFFFLFQLNEWFFLLLIHSDINGDDLVVGFVKDLVIPVFRFVCLGLCIYYLLWW